MGKLLQGINGPFSGKVGPVVGYMLGNQAVMRSLPGRSKRPLTPKQIHQRKKFALMNDFLGQLQSLLNLTFANVAINMTGSNKAFSYNVMNAIRGFYPDISIDYKMVLLAGATCPMWNQRKLYQQRKGNWNSDGRITAELARQNQQIKHSQLYIMKN